MSPRFYLDERVILDHLFLAMWRIFGLIAWPWLWMHPNSRRHIRHVPVPTPGRTWMHGASIGEHRNAVALLPRLGPVWRTHSSWRSHPQGSFPAPLDLPFVIVPWLNRTRPSRLILLEGELWPGWLIACRRRGIPVVVLAARKGAGWKRWQRVPRLFAWLTRDVQFMYSDDIGDLKRTAPKSTSSIPLPNGTIVGASTRSGDEQRLIKAWERLTSPRPKLVLAPRHLNRIDEIVSMVESHQIGRRSHGWTDDEDIWLLDTHGELSGLLANAHIAMIGGTFDPKIGGHSPSEAASGSAHLIRGPHTNANPSVWKELESTTVDSVETLHKALVSLAKEPPMQHPQNPVDLSAIVHALPEPVSIPETNRYPLLWPFVPIWQALSWVVRLFQRQQPDGNFVVVGGLVNGGAGRTPAAAWLAEQITHGFVVSAGYRRRNSGSELRFGQPDQEPEKDLGDELEMIRRRGMAVLSAPNRIQAIEQSQVNQIPIIDGGLGDPRLRSGFRIACIDGQTPLGRGPFPVGTRRLPWKTLSQVNAIWIANAPANEETFQLPTGVPIIRSTMRAVGWIHKGTIHSLDAVQGSVNVVVGIANPERFVCSLVDLGLHIQSLRIVGDHDSLGTVEPKTVVTEKDAARLPMDADVWALRMELDVDGGEALLQRIEEHCA